MTNSADRTIKELIQIDEVSEADTMPIWDDSLEGNNTKKIPVGMLLQSVIDIVHPVGSLYISENPTEPRLIFGGVWEKLPDGVFIRNSGGNAGEVGQIQPEGLPNITASARNRFVDYNLNAALGNPLKGAFKDGEFLPKSTYTEARPNSLGNYHYDISLTFDASEGNTTVPDGETNTSKRIYGNSNHVTPYNISFHMWKRIS